MLTWYCDNDLGIYFSKIPNIDMIFPKNGVGKKAEKCTKPFILENEVDVVLIDWKRYEEVKTYNFTIPKGYCWDGATIPRIFWRLIGAKTDPRFLIPSLIHDVLCENHNYIDNDRYFADKVFERLLYKSGVSAFSRWMMFHSVDNFQKFCRWKQEEL